MGFSRLTGNLRNLESRNIRDTHPLASFLTNRNQKSSVHILCEFNYFTFHHHRSSMKQSPQSTQTMSLLSMYLSGGTDSSKGVAILRSPVWRPDTKHAEDLDNSSETSEPPESLYYSKCGETTYDYDQIRNLRTSSPVSPVHDLAGSPLTSCSYQTLTKEYNMDTWRMYERIQAARLQGDKGLFSLVQEAVDQITYDSSGDDGNQESIYPISEQLLSGPLSEADDIFELEM